MPENAAHPGPVCLCCGAPVQADARFCGACGAPVGERVCRSCGAKLPAEVRFCGACGTPAAQAEGPATPPPPASSPSAPPPPPSATGPLPPPAPVRQAMPAARPRRTGCIVAAVAVVLLGLLLVCLLAAALGTGWLKLDISSLEPARLAWRALQL